MKGRLEISIWVVGSNRIFGHTSFTCYCFARVRTKNLVVSSCRPHNKCSYWKMPISGGGAERGLFWTCPKLTIPPWFESEISPPRRWMPNSLPSPPLHGPLPTFMPPYLCPPKRLQWFISVQEVLIHFHKCGDLHFTIIFMGFICNHRNLLIKYLIY